MNSHILTLAGELSRALVAEQDRNWRCLHCADAIRVLMDAMDDTVAITALQEAESLIRLDAYQNMPSDPEAQARQHDEQMDLIKQIESYLLRPQAF